MFLTFRACKTTANRIANEQLLSIIDDNLLDPTSRSAYGSKMLPELMLNDDYKEFLRVGISKFLTRSSAEKGYRYKLDSSYHYLRKSNDGREYYIIKIIARFTTIRKKGHLNNPRVSNDVYRESVAELFRSAAIDVNSRLSDATERKRVADDIGPVIQELEREGIVD